jgi:hypothetical protein
MAIAIDPLFKPNTRNTDKNTLIGYYAIEQKIAVVQFIFGSYRPDAPDHAKHDGFESDQHILLTTNI